MSAQSGVKIAENVADEFKNLKMKKIYKWITFKIEKDEEIVIDKFGERQKNVDDETQYNELTATLTADSPRYFIYDFQYIFEKTNSDKNEIALVTWCDDNGPVKKKMLYSSSKEAFAKALQIGKSIQCNDRDDLEYKNVLNQVKQTK